MIIFELIISQNNKYDWFMVVTIPNIYNVNKIVPVFTEHMLTLLIREDNKIKI